MIIINIDHWVVVWVWTDHHHDEMGVVVVNGGMIYVDR
jgi:hypothetical protein